MNKDDVLIDLENFSHDKQVEGARQVFEKIQRTICKDDQSNCACVLIHLDKEVDSRASTYISGSPESTIPILNNALKIAISQGVKSDKMSRHFLFNGMRLILEADLDKLGLDEKRKTALEEAIMIIGAICITLK